MLADARAIESTLGLNAGAVQISQKPKKVQVIADPKAELRGIARQVDSSSGRRRNVRRQGDRVDRLYAALAADVRFEALREVASFATYEAEMKETLMDKGLIAG